MLLAVNFVGKRQAISVKVEQVLATMLGGCLLWPVYMEDMYDCVQNWNGVWMVHLTQAAFLLFITSFLVHGLLPTEIEENASEGKLDE